MRQRTVDDDWETWFAWRPVPLSDETQGEMDVVRHAWLRWVERRRAYFALLDETITSYRLPEVSSGRAVALSDRSIEESFGSRLSPLS